MGSVDHSDFLKKIVMGDLIGYTSLKFDAEHNNYFAMIQKVHIVVIETTHLGFTKYMDENKLILDRRMDIRNSFMDLNQVV